MIGTWQLWSYLGDPLADTLRDCLDEVNRWGKTHLKCGWDHSLGGEFGLFYGESGARRWLSREKPYSLSSWSSCEKLDAAVAICNSGLLQKMKCEAETRGLPSGQMEEPPPLSLSMSFLMALFSSLPLTQHTPINAHTHMHTDKVLRSEKVNWILTFLTLCFFQRFITFYVCMCICVSVCYMCAGAHGNQ